MSDFPHCRWGGGQAAPGRRSCLSPKLVAAAAGVPPELCARCYCRDHEWDGTPPPAPSPPPPAPAPCRHRGELAPLADRYRLGLGVLREYYACGKGRGTNGYACPCRGCGPTCPDYAATVKEDEGHAPI